MSLNYDIVPYSPAMVTGLLTLEQESAQGRYIQFQMLRESYLSRSVVFEKYCVLVARLKNGEIAGVIAGAIVPFKRNGELMQCGIIYDGRVGKSYRNHGIMKNLTNCLMAEYFASNGIDKFISTMKKNNRAVLAATKGLPGQKYFTDFRYLMIPVSKFHGFKNVTPSERFHVELLSDHPLLKAYCASDTNTGAHLWQTDKMYRLKVTGVSAPVKLAKKLLHFYPKYQKAIPDISAEITFAMLFKTGLLTFESLGATADEAHKNSTDYIMVCSRADEPMYEVFKKHAISDYPYILASNFAIAATDALTLDVRIL